LWETAYTETIIMRSCLRLSNNEGSWSDSDKRLSQSKSMINDTLIQTLHDRATRGEALTDNEQTALEAWYEQQDQAEAAALGTSAPEGSTTLDTLREEIAASVICLREDARRIQARTEEDEALRREINTLSEKLIQTGSR